MLFLSCILIYLSAWFFFTAAGATISVTDDRRMLGTRHYDAKFCAADVSKGLLALLNTVIDWRMHDRFPGDPERVCFSWKATFAAGMIVSMLFSFLLTRYAHSHARLDRMLRFNLAALGLCFLTSLTLAACASLEYSNYAVRPPALDPKVVEAVQVHAFSAFNVSGSIVSGLYLNHEDEELSFFWLIYVIAAIHWDRTRVPFLIFVISFFCSFGILAVRTLVSLFFVPAL